MMTTYIFCDPCLTDERQQRASSHPAYPICDVFVISSFVITDLSQNKIAEMVHRNTFRSLKRFLTRSLVQWGSNC